MVHENQITMPKLDGANITMPKGDGEISCGQQIQEARTSLGLGRTLVSWKSVARVYSSSACTSSPLTWNVEGMRVRVSECVCEIQLRLHVLTLSLTHAGAVYTITLSLRSCIHHRLHVLRESKCV